MPAIVILQVLASLPAMNAIKRIWFYLIHPLPIGNRQFSVASLLAGILILILALFLSRRISRLLERRIAKRAYIDPGLRYTIARLANYFSSRLASSQH